MGHAYFIYHLRLEAPEAAQYWPERNTPETLEQTSRELVRT